jgi:putative phage-type endonuclease
MNNIDLYIIKHFNNNFEKLDKAKIFDNYSNEIKNSMKDNNIDINTEDIVSRLKTIKKYRKTLKELKKIPHIKQRTIEWLDARKNRLTASDLYDAIKGNSTSLTLAKKKANVVIDNTNYNAIPALKWGTMFESMAERCYSKKYDNINVNEFGLLCDKYNKHFAASPDGISDIGVMIEIKCPYSRKIIDGFIPSKYQMQMQGQLAVCELEECDYIECEFKTYSTELEFIENITESSDDIFGIIAEYNISEEGKKTEYEYLYSDDSDVYQYVYDSIKTKIASRPNENAKLIYWKLINMNIQRVNFNKKEWDETLPKIDEFWNKVEDCRGLPIENKISKKISFIEDD